MTNPSTCSVGHIEDKDFENQVYDLLLWFDLLPENIDFKRSLDNKEHFILNAQCKESNIVHLKSYTITSLYDLKNTLFDIRKHLGEPFNDIESREDFFQTLLNDNRLIDIKYTVDEYKTRVSENMVWLYLSPSRINQLGIDQDDWINQFNHAISSPKLQRKFILFISESSNIKESKFLIDKIYEEDFSIDTCSYLLTLFQNPHYNSGDVDLEWLYIFVNDVMYLEKLDILIEKIGCSAFIRLASFRNDDVSSFSLLINHVNITRLWVFIDEIGMDEIYEIFFECGENFTSFINMWSEPTLCTRFIRSLGKEQFCHLISYEENIYIIHESLKKRVDNREIFTSIMGKGSWLNSEETTFVYKSESPNYEIDFLVPDEDIPKNKQTSRFSFRALKLLSSYFK